MDKEILEKILKGEFNIQGDFVMEKKIEIGYVEAGGIGIQIINGDAQTKPNKPCADVGNLQSSDVECFGRRGENYAVVAAGFTDTGERNILIARHNDFTMYFICDDLDAMPQTDIIELF